MFFVKFFEFFFVNFPTSTIFIHEVKRFVFYVHTAKTTGASNTRFTQPTVRTIHTIDEIVAPKALLAIEAFIQKLRVIDVAAINNIFAALKKLAVVAILAVLRSVDQIAIFAVSRPRCVVTIFVVERDRSSPGNLHLKVFELVKKRSIKIDLLCEVSSIPTI